MSDKIELVRGDLNMEITDVRVRKVKNAGNLRAVASMTIDEEFVVHDIKIVDGQNGLFIAMPSRKLKEGDYRDIAHPLTPETRSRIRDIVISAYENLEDIVLEDTVAEE